MYDSVISRALKQNASVQADALNVSRRVSSMEPYQDRAKASMTTASSIKDIDSLPHLIPQRTNVLTGASTTYYAQKPAIWNTEYLKLVNYQRKKEESAYGDLRASSEEKLPDLPKQRASASQADLSNTTRARRSEKVHLPLRGHNLYIGDRIRDFWMRSEMLKAQNFQQNAINQV